MGKGSYFGGSTVIRGVGWALPEFGKNEPKVRLGQHAKKRRAAALARKARKQEAAGAEDARGSPAAARKATVLGAFSSFEAYQAAVAEDARFAVTQGIASDGAGRGGKKKG